MIYGDLGKPEDDISIDGDLIKYDDGKYIHKAENGELDMDKFNRDYGQYVEKRSNKMKRDLQLKLDHLNQPKKDKLIYELSIGEIFINIKDSMFGILDDLLKFNINNILTKNNRLFYLGLILIIIGVLAQFIVASTQ
jgi:hypothetical protein